LSSSREFCSTPTPNSRFFTLVPTIPLIWATRAFQKRIGASYRTMRRRLADMNSILSDTIGGIRVVQIFGQEDFEAQKFRAKSSEFAVAGTATQSLQALFYPSVALAFGIGQVIVWLYGGREVFANRLSVGELVMFSAYVSQFYAPVQAVANSANLFANTSASAERIYEFSIRNPIFAARPKPNRWPR
jgi:ABC-type multidrug transport system fused ATPase/permease subunit